MAVGDSPSPGQSKRYRLSPHWVTAIGTVALVVIALISYEASRGGGKAPASSLTTTSSAPFAPTTSTQHSSTTTSVQTNADSGGNPTLTLRPDSGTVGTQVVAIIRGFGPDEKLDFSFNGLEEGNEPTTSSNGSAIISFTIPNQFQGLSATATATADALFGPDQAEYNFTLTG
jgi:hypothetical protein